VGPHASCQGAVSEASGVSPGTSPREEESMPQQEELPVPSQEEALEVSAEDW